MIFFMFQGPHTWHVGQCQEPNSGPEAWKHVLQHWLISRPQYLPYRFIQLIMIKWLFRRSHNGWICQSIIYFKQLIGNTRNCLSLWRLLCCVCFDKAWIPEGLTRPKKKKVRQANKWNDHKLWMMLWREKIAKQTKWLKTKELGGVGKGRALG